jgi:transposase
MKKVAHVGVDYHVKTKTIAVYLSDEKRFLETTHLSNDDKVITKHMKKLSQHFDLRICYEASGSGYTFQRKMRALGIPCDVIAPSLAPRKPGERRKNDVRDAKRLAQHYAHGLLTLIHPPTEEEESVRSLVRCRFAFKEAVKRVKQQINALLLSQDHFWKRSKWTYHHRLWLRAITLPSSHLQLVLQEFLAHLDYLESRLHYLEQQIEQLASAAIYAPSVNKLRALRGIGTLTAMVLIAEITDFRRFASPRALMAFIGLIPGEDSSDGRRKPGSITKSGNRRCRTVLVEAAQHYARKPCVSYALKQNLSRVAAPVSALAVNCMQRLHKRYWFLVCKGKMRQKAIVAVARELVGFIWALMHEPAEAVAAA